MIYQLYFRPDQVRRCFEQQDPKAAAVYRTFPNSPALNPDLLRVLPELKDKGVEAQAREAAGIFYLARTIRPYDPHPWVGTTSWKQTDKVAYRFPDVETVETLLNHSPVLAWYMLDFGSGCWTQGEQHHPGLLQYIREIHQRTPKIITAEGLAVYEDRQTRRFPFASYWLTTWDLFEEFVADLTPEWDYMVANYKTDPYLSALTYAPNGVLNCPHGGLSGAWSAFFERYFGIWLVQKNIKPLGLRPNHGDPRWCLEDLRTQHAVPYRSASSAGIIHRSEKPPDLRACSTAMRELYK